jgi:4-amino-4-deoxy-L-arabinose transferase-like glycosyltransferase
VAARLHFLLVPLNTDEGGFAAIARLWGDGETLYGDVAWVDRPQGLLVLFRLAGLAGSDEVLRLLAVTAGVLTAIGVAAAAWAIAGRPAAVIAAFAYALLSPAPHLEGFAANGELLSATFATGAVALALWWRRGGATWLLPAAAVLAGCAPLVKQSAIDGAIVVVAAAMLGGAAGRVRRLALVALCGVAPAALALLHAARGTAGVSAWWYAIAGYRSSTESAITGDLGARLRLLADAVPPALQDLAPLLVLAVVALATRRGWRSLPAVWLGAAVLGFLGGGLYHPHYWLQLVPPLAVLAAATLVQNGRRLVAVAAAALAVVVAFSAEVYAERDAQRISALTSGDTRLASAAAVGRALVEQSAPGDRIYVIWANAAVYWYAPDRRPAFRYLWYLNVQRIPGAAAAVRDILTGPAPPRAIAVYQLPGGIDPSGAVERTLRDRYDLVRLVDGVPVYRLRGAP